MEKNELWRKIIQTVHPIGTTGSPEALDLSDPDVLAQLEGVDMKEMYYKAMHRFEDMFIDCYIKSAAVNCTKFFTPTMQQTGMCYMFNSEEFIQDHGRFHSDRSGPPFGLRVTLNVEQYEHYASPLPSAGFQVV